VRIDGGEVVLAKGYDPAYGPSAAATVEAVAAMTVPEERDQ
jgi:hypothetical protein